MIESKIVLDWAKKEIEHIDYYLNHDWNYAFDVDFDNEQEYKEHCYKLSELREKMVHAKEYLQEQIFDYESYLADLEINANL